MQNLNMLKKKSEIDDIQKIKDKKVRERIISTLNVMCSSIAIGLLQKLICNFCQQNLITDFLYT